MTDYFGEAWPSGFCETGEQRPTPTGEPCAWCKIPIVEPDQGLLVPSGVLNEAEELTFKLLPWHKECMLRSTAGSLAHLDGGCSCTGRTEPPGPQTPEERRNEALVIWARLVG